MKLPKRFSLRLLLVAITLICLGLGVNSHFKAVWSWSRWDQVAVNFRGPGWVKSIWISPGDYSSNNWELTGAAIYKGRIRQVWTESRRYRFFSWEPSYRHRYLIARDDADCEFLLRELHKKEGGLHDVWPWRKRDWGWEGGIGVCGASPERFTPWY